MDGTRDQFFSGTALAFNQDRALRGGDGANGLLQLFHGPADTDNVVERIAGRGIALEREVLTAESNFFQGAVDGQLDFVEQGGRLTDVVGCASGFDGLNG